MYKIYKYHYWKGLCFGYGIPPHFISPFIYHIWVTIYSIYLVEILFMSNFLTHIVFLAIKAVIIIILHCNFKQKHST